MIIMKRVDWRVATLFVQERHYSPVMPKLTKHWLGAYQDDELVGVLTLGWGTNPMGTIKKMFPELSTEDYYEIGKMCMDDEMPRNSESQMISATVKWMKETHQNENTYTLGQMELLVNLAMFIKLQTFCMVVLYGVMCTFLKQGRRFTFVPSNVK